MDMTPDNSQLSEKAADIAASGVPESFPPVTETESSDTKAHPISSSPPTTSRRTWALSVIMLLLYVTLGTAAAQLTNYAFADRGEGATTFKAPYLFTMIKLIFRAQALTIYLTGNFITKLVRGRTINFSRTWSRCTAIFGEDGLTWRVVVFRFFPPTIFNLAVQILFTLSMSTLAASVATALSAPAVATSYLFSCIFLRQPALVIKIIFVLVAFAGVGLITYDQFSKTVTTSSVTGIVCVLVSDLCLSSYQLCFKKAFPKGDFGQVSLAVTGMFLFMCFLFWPVPVIVKVIGQEVYDIRLLPYDILFGAWICSALGAMVYGYGLVLANPFFMSLSELLIMIANTGLDAGIRNVHIQIPQIIGTTMIGIAFLVVIIPDDLLQIRNLHARCRKLFSKGQVDKNFVEVTHAGATSEGKMVHTNL